jgi:hypothetical protein
MLTEIHIFRSVDRVLDNLAQELESFGENLVRSKLITKLFLVT